MVILETCSGKQHYVHGKWQLNANGLYELPAGFEISGNLFMRHGYPNPIFLNLEAGFDGRRQILPDDFRVTDGRFDTIVNLDLRLANRIKLGDSASVTLSAELFNIFNSNTVMANVYAVDSAAFGRIDEIMAPRILRLGARLNF